MDYIFVAFAMVLLINITTLIFDNLECNTLTADNQPTRVQRIETIVKQVTS